MEIAIIDHINTSGRTVTIPQKGKQTIVIPVPEKGKYPTEITSYRPNIPYRKHLQRDATSRGLKIPSNNTMIRKI
ncbi:hypothetical protein CHS0354_025212 [Potamilus streckersoni]|uniref:Uncharacterized protein n=1 Tax=Potamilus streckersoni TaxID=2493646 RepID=A0AAE0VH30_9BIVA|nr:hypothetical protein CHS0354_025212 [Potamilus streckersoni]